MYPKKHDIGWMCHVVPLRKKGDLPKPAPPISSIPVIGLQPDEGESSGKHSAKPYANFRPTDTPLIRLQKMGGRKDLLCFRENEPNRGYVDTPPRCQWYYLEDNALNDLANQVKREEREVTVPAYMHYQGCVGIKETPITQSITETPWPSFGLHKKKAKQPKMPQMRAGYSEYNKVVNPLSIARRDVIYPNHVTFPKNLPSDQPDTMADLLTNRYAHEDYASHRGQWREVYNLNQPRATCKPSGIKYINASINPKKKKY